MARQPIEVCPNPPMADRVAQGVGLWNCGLGQAVADPKGPQRAASAQAESWQADPLRRSLDKEPSECKQRPSDLTTKWAGAGQVQLYCGSLRSVFLRSAKGSVLSQNGYVLVTPTQSGAVLCLATPGMQRHGAVQNKGLASLLHSAQADFYQRPE